MSKVTIEQIESKQDALSKMIAELKAQTVTEYVFPETEIQLKHGELYAGLILGKDGAPSHHLILLPTEAEKMNWQDALAWAGKAGGELPNRREQALLYANLKEQFQEAWYWSSEAHASDSKFAWCQHFSDGNQDYDDKDTSYRARAIRRLVIE